MKRSAIRRFLTAGAVAASVLTANSAMAAVDMFIKIGNIVGESQDKDHKNEVDVLAWSWGASRGSAQTKKGLLPAACIQDLNFTKYIDSATPEIILNAVTGGVVPTARLTVRKAGVTNIEYLKLQMTNVSVSSYSTGGSGGEDRLTENVTLHFDTMIGVYRRQLVDGAGPEETFTVSGDCPH